MSVPLWAYTGIGSIVYYTNQSHFQSRRRVVATKMTDYVPSTLTVQGAYLPLLIGTRRIGPVLAWAGDRIYVKRRGGNRGQKGSRRLAAQAEEPPAIYEAGWHQLCVGPATRLTKIWEEGKVIWEGDLNSTDDPSGSTVPLDDGSEFVIYWGDSNQAVNTFLADASRVGVPSKWPSLCYVQWTRKLIGRGDTARWPSIEYELQCDPHLNHGEGWTGISSPMGANPAYGLMSLLFSQFPWGCNLAGEPGNSEFDTANGESFYDFAAETDLGVQLSVLAADGVEAKSVIESILRDHSLNLSWDPATGKWVLIRVREPVGTITVPSDAVSELPQIETLHGETPPDRLTFSFADSARQYRDSTIGQRADGQTGYLDVQKSRSVPLPTVVRFADAAFLAVRRSQEELAGQITYALKLTHAARLLRVGDTIATPELNDANGDTPVLRVTKVSLDPNTQAMSIECTHDYGGAEVFVPPALDAGDAGGAGGEGSVAGVDPVVEDEQFTFVETPAFLLGGALPSVVVPRVRGADNVDRAELYLSLDDVTYDFGGQEDSLIQGGTLLDAMTATDPYVIEQGPTFTALGPDIATVEDLSSDEGAWKRGVQVAVIGEELFFLRNVTAMGGNVYRLDGLLRARYDTNRAAHGIGSEVYIFQFDQITDMATPMLYPNRTLYVKSQPYANGQGFDLSAITPVSKTLVGKGITPMQPGRVRVTAPFPAVAAWQTGNNISFEWTYRSAMIPGTGAGMQGAGEATGSSPLSSAERFEIKFLTTGNVLKRTVLQTGNTYTYANADLVADFAGEPTQFKIEVRLVNGGFKSPLVTKTLTRI